MRRTRLMRIRNLILIIVAVGWLSPAGTFVCPPHPAEADDHFHAARDDGHEHAHAAGHYGDATHDHAAPPESQKSRPGAPLEISICCSDEMSPPAVFASLVDAKPRPKSTPIALASPVLGSSQPVVLSKGARLWLLQPASLPYARTRRPLLI